MCLGIMSRDIANQDPWRSLTRYTAARIGIGRAGVSVPTQALLEFQLAHAQARDAVHRAFDGEALQRDLSGRGWEVLRLHSAAADRQACTVQASWMQPVLATSAETYGREKVPYSPARCAIKFRRTFAKILSALSGPAPDFSPPLMW